MNFQEINVYPNIKVYKTICKAHIHIVEMSLFESVRFMVRLLNENNEQIESRELELNKSNGYDDWGNDDNFILKWVKTQLSVDNITPS